MPQGVPHPPDSYSVPTSCRLDMSIAPEVLQPGTQPVAETAQPRDLSGKTEWQQFSPRSAFVIGLPMGLPVSGVHAMEQ